MLLAGENCGGGGGLLGGLSFGSGIGSCGKDGVGG